MTGGFADFVRTATGHTPYPYQSALAADGLPALLSVPTGAGKTVAGVLPWLYRRLVSAPESTPRRLVYVLPAPSLAEQTLARAGEWLERLGYSSRVGLHLLAGAAAQGGAWRRRPEQTAILVGTHEMLLSRALMRGFADWAGMAPVSFALLHTDTQWVFDEAPLLGPALATGLRLQQLRDRFGTPAPTASMWMSASGDPAGLLPRVELGEADRRGALAVRLNAVRRVGQLTPDPAHYLQGLVDALGSAHVPGTQSVAVLNTTARARALHDALRKAHPDREVLLLHPLFRAADQRLPGPECDRVVVTTATAEAGLDLSSRTLLTELAPWASIVQRAGRCNRAGEHPEGGDLLWCRPPTGPDAAAEAGADADTEAAARWLTAHEGRPVTTTQLHEARPAEAQPDQPRPDQRRPDQPDEPDQPLSADDLLELFDTAAERPVDRWIGPAEQLTALVAWRDWESGEPAEDEADPGTGELCPVPLAELRRLPGGRAWIRDRLDWRWRPATAEELHPGATLLLDARHGGYLPELGWSPESRTPVTPVGGSAPAQRTYACTAWVSLDQHLMETEEEARALLAALPGLTAEQHEAVARAARYHDLGKCHEAFQTMLRGGGGDQPDGLLAKSKAPYSTGVNPRPHFRHELVSALILLNGEHWHGERTDHPLITYLAAAHHGQVRVSVRPRPAEAPLLLGVQDGDRTPAVDLSTGEHFPAQSLRTEVFHSTSWTAAALALRDRPDLGPFRLAYLETLVRIADWRSSARHDGPVQPATTAR